MNELVGEWVKEMDSLTQEKLGGLMTQCNNNSIEKRKISAF